MRIKLLLRLVAFAFCPLAAVWAQTPIREISENAPKAPTVAMLKQEAAFKQLAANSAAKAAAACTNTTTLDFAQRPTDEPWKNHVPVNVGAANTNTTISTAGSYVEPAGGTQTNLLVSNNGGVLNRKPLFWSSDYTSNANATTQITFSFNRPVNNFSLQIQDVDFGPGSWIDVVTFTARQTDGTVLNLSAASDATVTHNTTYNTLSGNKITGILNNVSNSEQATVAVTFNKPIVSFQITYQNTIAQSNPGVQYIGIDYMTWCTQSNVATTLNGPARAVVGAPVTYTVTTTTNGDYDASSVRPTVQLPAGLNSQSPVFPRGSNYNNTTGLLTLLTLPTLAVRASSISFIKFNMPNVTVTGRASSTIDTDDADPLDNNGTLAAANVTTVINGVPTATAKSVTASANTATFQKLPPMTGTDLDNDVLTYTIVGSSIANINFGVVYYTRNGVRTALAGTSDVVLTAAEATTLEFKNATGTVTSSGTLSYSVSDIYGGRSSAVAYTIGVANQPAVYTSPNTFLRSLLADNEVLASVTDPDGIIASATRVQQPVGASDDPFILFSTTTGQFTANVQTAAKRPAVGTYVYDVTTVGVASGTSVTSVTITITETDIEAAYSSSNIYNRDALATGATLATVADADGPVTNATMTATPVTGITLNATTGTFTVNSTTAPVAGTYTYTVNTADRAGGTTAAPVTIIIRDDVEAAYTAAQSYNQDALINNDALAVVTDADGPITSAMLASGSLPAGSALNSTTGTFSVNNAATMVALVKGTYSFTVNTVDATGGRSTSQVAVILFETEAAYSSAAAKSTSYANGFSLATVMDGDGDIVDAILSASTLPAGVGLNTATGQFTVIDRTLLQSGTYIVRVRTTDATGGLTVQDVTINIGTRPLPVSLVSFTAKAAGSDAKLTWATASEKNNDYFDVERSLNGTDFVKIGQVKGQGSKSAPTDYALTDAGIGTKVNGTVYYRLQQVDADGTATYSPVRTAAFIKALALAPAITLFPNPATTTTKLDLTQLPTGTYQVSLLDATGRVVLNTTLSAGLIHGLNLNSLASGTYTVLVHGQNGSETINLTKRLIKE